MRILGFVIFFTIKMVCPASAMVGGAQEIPAAHTQPEVMFVGSSGNFCTGRCIARDLVLTAAHCVHAGDSYKLVELGPDRKPMFKDMAAIARHPQFNLKTMLAHRATADVALMKLKIPRPGYIAPLLPVAAARSPSASVSSCAATAPTIRGDGNSAGRLREAALVAIGQPGNLQLRLVDPATGGDATGPRRLHRQLRRAGLPGDASGFAACIGVVSWSTGPNFEDGCGGFHRRHAARALSQLDKGTGKQDG